METERGAGEERVPSQDESQKKIDEATDTDVPPVDGPGGETTGSDLGSSQDRPGDVEGGGTSGL